MVLPPYSKKKFEEKDREKVKPVAVFTTKSLSELVALGT